MKCPFELPVTTQQIPNALLKGLTSPINVIQGRINSRRGVREIYAFSDDKEYADYIVQAINSHEKSKDIIFEVSRQAIAKYDINAPPLTKNRFANEFVDSFKQALKEAGESK